MNYNKRSKRKTKRKIKRRYTKRNKYNKKRKMIGGVSKEDIIGMGYSKEVTEKVMELAGGDANQALELLLVQGAIIAASTHSPGLKEALETTNNIESKARIEALNIILTIQRNTKKTDAKFKKLNMKKPKFVKRIGQYPSALELIKLLGWKVKEGDEGKLIYEENQSNDENIKFLSDYIDRLVNPPPPKPIILFLTLDPRLNDRVIVRHEDLPIQANQRCPNFEVKEEEFGFDKSMDEILSKLDDKTVAHLVIVTHGDKHFLYCGALYAHLADDAPAFNRFSDTLRRILLPRSSILITACLTGKINEESDARSYHLETHKNCDYDNWANNLSKNLIGHRIFCTPDGQAANEIILDTSLTGGEEMCGKEKKGDPVSFIYYSSEQIMYAFIHDGGATECEIEVFHK